MNISRRPQENKKLNILETQEHDAINEQNFILFKIPSHSGIISHAVKLTENYD